MDESLTNLQIAGVCHQVNKAYCESLGDGSQVDWDEAPDWQKDSAVKGVDFHINNNDSTPEDSHNSWLKEKEADGWKWGSVKDAEAKTHPCYVPYKELPKEQQAKDYIFHAIVKSLTKF